MQVHCIFKQINFIVGHWNKNNVKISLPRIPIQIKVNKSLEED